jgi:hypothetical protein
MRNEASNWGNAVSIVRLQEIIDLDHTAKGIKQKSFPSGLAHHQREKKIEQGAGSVTTDLLTFLERREIRLNPSRAYQCGVVQQSGQMRQRAQRRVPGRQIVLV